MVVHLRETRQAGQTVQIRAAIAPGQAALDRVLMKAKRFAARRALPIIAVLALGVGEASCAPATVRPSPDRIPAAALARADSLLEAAVAREEIPGAVLVVTQDGRIVHERAFGHAQLYDYGMRRLASPRPMHTSTLFDLASVTKVMATTYALMLLADRGAVDVDAPVYRYLPEFRGAHLDSITVRHLLTHSAGLLQWQPIYYHAATREQAYDVIRSMPLGWGVGAGRHYSDLGFMLLGYLVERVSGQPLDEFIEAELYDPLGLQSTTFNPKERGFTSFAATSHGNPYEHRMVHDTAFGYDYDGDPDSWNGWRDYTLAGEVNDGNAWYAHGGVAGHAGLFSTGHELAVLLNVLLAGGTHEGRRILSTDVIEQFLQVPDMLLLNVNLPAEPKGLLWTHQSVRHYEGYVISGEDPFGRTHYWFAEEPRERLEEGTDRWAIENGYVSITPLRLDLTDEFALQHAKVADPTA